VDEATLATLREALALTPDNVPLREHFAATLLAAGRAGEAETEYREALTRGAGAGAQLGLARAFFALGKLREAGVLAEALAESEPDNAGAQLLLARIVLNDGRPDEARERYTRAVQLDASLSDPDLAAALAAGEAKRERVPAQAYAGDEDEADAFETVAAERPRITFDNVGGMDEVKEEIRMKIVHPFTQPESSPRTARLPAAASSSMGRRGAARPTSPARPPARSARRSSPSASTKC
jgi:tetratricopeptide (TPR) repeat protein